MRKAIFFDNDGVLVDTEKWFFCATKEIMAQYGFELCADDFLEYFLRQNTGLWHVLEGVKNGSLETEELRTKRDELFMRYLLSEDIYSPGVKEFLELLSEEARLGGLLIGVVTSSQLKHFQAVHSRTGFEKYFDFVLTREDYANSKPDPEPYRLALERSGCKPGDVLVIEDSPRGVSSARAAELECWVVPSLFTKNFQFPDPVRRIASWDEVLDWAREEDARL